VSVARFGFVLSHEDRAKEIAAFLDGETGRRYKVNEEFGRANMKAPETRRLRWSIKR